MGGKQSLSPNNLEPIATHSSTLAWKIPWMEEPGGLQSMGSLRVRHNWATSLSLFIFMHWRRKWQPTPVFLPGESQGQGSLVSCRLRDRTVGHDWSDLAAAATVLQRLWFGFWAIECGGEFCVSEFCFHVWSGHCPLVYSVSY